MDGNHTVEMQTIESLYKKVEEMQKRAGNEFLIKGEYKKGREEWVLARFVQMYNCIFNETIMYWKCNEAPDFVSYDCNRKKKYYEITEILKKGERRGDEYKKPMEDFRPIPESTQTDLWANFQNVLIKKLQKRYSQDCELVMYYNVWTIYLGEKEFNRQLKENTEKFFSYRTTKFSRIWLITDNNKYFFCLYPEFHRYSLNGDPE